MARLSWAWMVVTLSQNAILREARSWEGHCAVRDLFFCIYLYIISSVSPSHPKNLQSLLPSHMV